MHNATVILKNGHRYDGSLWLCKPHEGILSLVEAWEYLPNDEPFFHCDEIVFQMVEIESAIEEPTIVGMDENKKAIVAEIDLLEKWRALQKENQRNESV